MNTISLSFVAVPRSVLFGICLSAMLLACTTTEKKTGEGASAKASGSASASVREGPSGQVTEQIGGAKSDATDMADPIVDTDSDKNQKSSTIASPAHEPAQLDPRYKTLSKILRSDIEAKTVQLQDEAARILGGSANDPTALNTLAMLYLRAGRTKAAKLLLGRALEKNEAVASLHNNLALVLLAEGDQEAAIVEFKRALRIDDKDREASGNLGSIYARGGELDKAFGLLEVSYRGDHSNLAVANNYALALQARKEFASARTVFEDAYKLNSSDVVLDLNYAGLLIEDLNKPKEGLDLVYRVKFLENQRKDVLARVNALEKKAKSELK